MRLSKYNYIFTDSDENLILYNFLSGINSITRVSKCNTDKFAELFLKPKTIVGELYLKYQNIINALIEKGILISNDTDESVILDSIHYNISFKSELALTILPTGNCNFRCPYCYESSQQFYRTPMKQDAQNALLKFIFRNIPKYTSIHVAWFGGEPLLEAKTIQYLSDNIINACDTRHIPYSSEIITNGYLLTPELFDSLYKLKIYNYMITLDGSKKQHDSLRCLSNGCGSFDTIINNLKYIYDSKKYKFAHIVIRVNVSAGFFDEFDNFMEFLSDMFGNDRRFEFMFVPVTLDPKETNLDIFVNPTDLTNKLNSNQIYKDHLSNDDTRLVSIKPEPQCTASKKNSYVITPDLSVYKCYSHFEYKENKLGLIDINGNLLIDESLHNRWYLSNRYLQKIPDSCIECFYLPCCRQANPGCPIRYIQPHAGIGCPSKDPEFKNMLQKAIIYAMSTIKYLTIEF